MISSEQTAVCVVSLLALWTCALGHTVYRGYSDKVAANTDYDRQGAAVKPYTRYRRRQNVDEEEEGEGEADYQTKIQPKYTHPRQPDADCQYNGDILANPSDRCSYLECHYGDEAWQGQKQLLVRVRQCPPGTAVAMDAKQVLFSPIQYDPTERVDQAPATDYGNRGNHGNRGNRRNYGNYGNYPSYKYKNNYIDSTAICAEAADVSTCKAFKHYKY